MICRKATQADLAAVAQIYADTHTEIEAGRLSVGWIRSIYPGHKTAEAALERGDLFVAEDDGKIVGTAIINQRQEEVYADASWDYPAPDDHVMVLHTLVIAPKHAGKGYGKAFVRFYEQYAKERECPYLRMDTNAINLRAQTMYFKMGYHNISTVPCEFNGIPGVRLMLLEKKLKL